MKIDDKEALLTGFIVFLFHLLFSVCIEYTYRCLQIKKTLLKKEIIRLPWRLCLCL